MPPLVIESSAMPRAGDAAAPVTEPPEQAEGKLAAPAIKTLVHTEGDAAAPVIDSTASPVMESSVRSPGRKYPLGIAQKYQLHRRVPLVKTKLP